MEGKGNSTSGTSAHIAGLVLARRGSVGIPRKNIRRILGYPLIRWVLKPMIECKMISSIWVSTDDEEIAQVALKCGATVHYRDSHSADNTSSSLMAVQEFILSHPEVSIVALVQCTSPCLSSVYLEQACNMIINEAYDSVFSVVRQHKLRWMEVESGQSTKPLNFNPHNRPRRQDWPGELVESGHFYFSRVSLIKNGLLQGNRCGYIELPQNVCVEIDTETDWIIAEQLLKLCANQGECAENGF